MTHDAVLLFSKSWGGLYLLTVFLSAVGWAYWPSRKEELDKASLAPLDNEDTPCR